MDTIVFLYSEYVFCTLYSNYPMLYNNSLSRSRHTGFFCIVSNRGPDDGRGWAHFAAQSRIFLALYRVEQGARLGPLRCSVTRTARRAPAPPRAQVPDIDCSQTSVQASLPFPP